MAEKKLCIKDPQWCKIMNRVHYDGSSLTNEAQKLGITLEELIKMGDEYHKGRTNEGEKEWGRTKRESAPRDKKFRPKKKKTTPVPAPAPAPTPAPASEPTPAPTPADPMEELRRNKDELQRKVASCAASLEEAEEILQIRQGALKEAQGLLEKAQLAVKKAEADEAEAKTEVQQAQAELAKVQGEIQQVEQEIQELREKSIYLIDPWFTGTLPEYGTFLSTVEMEGVKTQAVPEEYLPEASLEGVLLFDFVPDYKKARVFCGLVAKFELEETPYSLLVSDERVKKLLDMYIGK